MTTPLRAEDERSDTDLIEAWKAGEEAAGTELVHRHGKPLARFLGAAGAGEDVEDLVQETFVRAFRRIETFRGGSSFRTWLMTIGSNALKDAWRKRKRRSVIPLDAREIVDESSDPHGDAVAGDIAMRVSRCVQGLPRLQRDVFLLRAQQGLDYDEIAKALDTTPGSARVHYHHAVKRLKDMLE